jgi:hypothetical protein
MAFTIPPSFLEKLYELTGDGQNYKGCMVFFTDEDGCVRQYIRCQNPLTLDAMRKKAETYLVSMDEQESVIGRRGDVDDD